MAYGSKNALRRKSLRCYKIPLAQGSIFSANRTKVPEGYKRLLAQEVTQWAGEQALHTGDLGLISGIGAHQARKISEYKVWAKRNKNEN